jgi:hypothetical protein
MPSKKEKTRVGGNSAQAAQQKGEAQKEKTLPWASGLPASTSLFRLNSLSENIFLTADLKRKRSLSFYPQSPHMALL